ncbi:MAG TPA: hypothetical protein VHT75_00290 [Acidimicrobiales bacterium]|nr:hypothetical protein [Acidimicrobiales bacterium]
MTDSAQAELESWRRWVAEIEDHPLDRFEYEALLASRDGLAWCIEVRGAESLRDQADEPDTRFMAVTVEVDDSEYAGLEQQWWRRRLPARDEFRRYLAGDY